MSKNEYTRITQDFCSFSRRKKGRLAGYAALFTTQKMDKKTSKLRIFFAGNRLCHGFGAWLVIFCAVVSGCATTDDYYSGLNQKSLHYRVKKGDTLYGISSRAGRDYREIATWNGLSAPYRIFEGQTIRLFPPADVFRKLPEKEKTAMTIDQNASGPIPKKSVQNRTKPVPIRKKSDSVQQKPAPTGKKTATGGKQPASAEKQLAPFGIRSSAAEQKSATAGKKPTTAEKQSDPTGRKPATAGKPFAPTEKKSSATEKKSAPAENNSEKSLKLLWHWPLQGVIAKNYSQTGGKGLEISGKYGEPVRAAAEGIIVYCGQGLIGYGNLVIVKHDAHFLSAYGNNSRLLVQEGEYVKIGQRIAEVGLGTDKQPILHFEIRRDGKPVNPIQHLPKP